MADKPNGGGLISQDWFLWLTILKQRVEDLPGEVAAENIIGPLQPDQIPQLPSSRLTFTNSPRLLGRTTAGSGPSEEIQVAGGLQLTGGVLSALLVPGGYTIGDLFYANTINSIARLSDVSAGSYLRSGGVGVAPLWSTLKLPNAVTAGSVVFGSATDTYGQDNAHLFWDDTNNFLGVGTLAPTATLHVASALASTCKLENTTVNGRIWGIEVVGTGASANGVLLFIDRTSNIRRGIFRNDGTVAFGSNIGNDAGSGAIIFAEPILGVGINNNINLSAFTVIPGADVTDIGGTTAANAATTIVGVGTLFRTTLGIGDRISLSSAAATFATVTAIASNTSLTVDTALGNGTTQTINRKKSIFRLDSLASTARMVMNDSGNVGVRTTVPTAVLHLGAGTVTANTAPLKFTSGTLLGTAEAGAMEFLTDGYYLTITTGAARKGILLDDGSALTAGRVPFATTGGRLTDDADLTFATDTLSATKVLAPTSVSTPSLISTTALTVTPASGSNLNVSLATTGDLVVNTTQLYVDTSAAQVGVGTATPADVLDVKTATSNGVDTPGVFIHNEGSGAGTGSSLKIGYGSTTGTYAAVAGTFKSPGVAILIKTATNGSSLPSEKMRVEPNGNVGIGQTTPTAYLHFKAGTTAASSAPLKFTSGSLLTTAEAGAVEFLTDGYYATITTGAARKGIVLDDGTALTSGRVPFATTNGRLTDDADLTFATDTLTATKLSAPTSVSTGTLAQTGKTTTYNNVATAGWGEPAIYGSGRSTAQVAAVASVAAYTCGAADGSFIVSMNVNVTTSTTHNFTAECAYTDETNTARVLTLTFSQLAGVFVTAITNVTGAGPYEGVPMHIRVKASTAITLRTQAAGTYTIVTYNVEGLIEQVA